MNIRRALMLATLYWFLLGPASAQAVTLNFQPDTLNLWVGDQFNVEVVISGNELVGDWFSDGNDLSSFEFNVNYSSAVLNFESYVLGTDLGVADNWSFGPLPEGQVNLAQVSYEPDLSFQPDAFTLATLRFTAVAPAVGDEIWLSDIVLGDFLGDPLISDPNPLVLNILPIPEPGTMILLGIALVGAAGAGRKKQA